MLRRRRDTNEEARVHTTVAGKTKMLQARHVRAEIGYLVPILNGDTRTARSLPRTSDINNHPNTDREQ